MLVLLGSLGLGCMKVAGCRVRSLSMDIDLGPSSVSNQCGGGSRTILNTAVGGDGGRHGRGPILCGFRYLNVVVGVVRRYLLRPRKCMNPQAISSERYLRNN